MLEFDGENSYPGCKQCGDCCRINVIAMTHEEVERIRAFLETSDFTPIDYGKERCCLQREDMRCGVWEARSQTCKLHNCTASRFEILAAKPDLQIPDDLPWVDMHDCFILGDDSDPRYR